MKYQSKYRWWLLAATTLTLALGAATSAGANDDQLTGSQEAQVTVNTQETSSLQETQTTTGSSVVAAQPQSNVETTTSEKNGWVKDDSSNQWTYYEHGQVTTGRNYSYLPTIGKDDGSCNWYLVDNGVVQSGVQKWAGTYYDFDPTTYLRVDNNYVQSQWGDWYMFGQDGRIATKVYQWAGTYYYFDPTTYLRVDNDYRQSQWGDWYMFGKDGRIATKVYQWAGTYYYFDPVTYLRVDNDYRQSQWGDWYMFGSDGRIVSGIKEWYGNYYYFDPNTYLKATSNFTLGKADYYVDPSGVITGVLLNAPYINQYQVGDMACEATALLEALHVKGYAQNYDIQSFIKTMPISTSGNPNEGFGGGYQKVTPGIFQSIYPTPLAKWGSNFGTVQNISGATPAELRQQLVNGNPAVVYVTMHWAAPQYGHYWWGTGVNNSHVMTLDGYRNGQYHVEDPAGGSYWVSASNFENSYNIKRFAVVVK